MQTRQLPVPLTDEEQRLKGAEAARVGGDLAALKIRRKNEAEASMAETKRLTTARDELDRDIRAKTELRPVVVTEDHDHRLGVVRIIRDDTGEVVETRAMRADERKTTLDLFPGGGSRKAPTAELKGDLTAPLDAARKARRGKKAAGGLPSGGDEPDAS